MKNIPRREKSGNLEMLRKSGNFMKMVTLFHKDTTICKVVESFIELFLFERLQAVSWCGTPLLISYLMKYILFQIPCGNPDYSSTYISLLQGLSLPLIF